MSLARELRCLVCQNETLADSQAELAGDLRAEIRKMMEAGKTDAEITAFLTSRYGDFILYRPPFKPATLILWCGPFLMLGAGMFVLYRYLKRQAAETS
jgi:cytochrome c-type biogenesis protein CcmH